VPLSTDNAEINHPVTIPSGTIVEIFDLSLNNTLTVNGTLIVYGNLETGNNSELIANSGSSIFIFGDAILANRVSLDLSSYFVVKGNFTKAGSSNQGDLTISGAHIYIFGEVDLPTDSNGIPWGNFSVCSTGNYDGTTESTNDVCDAGQLDDFVDNVDTGELPDGIYDQLVDCYTPTASISGDATICDDDFTTITIDFTGTGPWEITTQRNGDEDLTVTNIDVNPYTFQVSEAGVYKLTTVSDANCTGTTLGSATITVNPLPQGSLTTNGPFCGSGNGQLTWTAAAGTGPFTVIYNDGTTDRTKIGVVSRTAFDVATNPVTSITTYTLVSVTDANGCMRSTGFTIDEATITINEFNMVVSDATLTPSGNHCPEFGGPFNANSSSYNPGVTEVKFKVTKEESTTNNWTFDFAIEETGGVEVYDLVSVTDNNDNTIAYIGNDAGGSLIAGDNIEVTFTFWIVNVPGTALNVKFTVSGGDDGVCSETGSTDDNSIIHVINVMPAVGSFTP